MRASVTKKKRNVGGYLFVLIVVICCPVFELTSTCRLSSQIEQSTCKTVLNYANMAAARLHDRIRRYDISLMELGGDLEEAQNADPDNLLDKLRRYQEIWECSANGVIFEDGRTMLADGSLITLENEINLHNVAYYSEQLNLSQQTILEDEVLVFAKPVRFPRREAG